MGLKSLRSLSEILSFCVLSASLSACILKRADTAAASDAGDASGSTSGGGTTGGGGTGTGGTGTGTGGGSGTTGGGVDTSTPALTAADLAGATLTTYYVRGQNGNNSDCHNITSGEFGADLDNGSYTKTLSFYATGRYLYSVTFYQQPECQHAMSQTMLFDMSQFGTFTIVGKATTPSTATQIHFHGSYSGGDDFWTTVGTAAAGSAWRTEFDSYCSGIGTALTYDDTHRVKNLAGRHCAHSGHWLLPDFGVQGSATPLDYYNTVELSGLTLSIGAGDGLWDVGSRSTYPTALNSSYSK